MSRRDGSGPGAAPAGAAEGTAPGPAPLDRDLLVVAGIVVLGALMTILDTTVVPVAIRTLGRDLDAPLSSIQWVSTAYLLALAIVIPLSGWASTRFGTRRLWIASVALFAAGSALAGLAWSAESLVAFRVLQGLGGGMVMPVGMTIIARAAGPARMGRVMSLVGIPMLLGPVLGPLLGGLLVDHASWRWIFWVNLPVGLIALPLAARAFPRDEPERAARLDVVGLALLPPGLAALVYGLSRSADRALTDVVVLAPSAAGAVLLAAFVLHALRAPAPLLDLRLFRTRAFAGAAGVSVLFAAGMYGAMFVLPLYLQGVRGQDALTTGLLIAPQGIGAAMVMPLAGRLVDRGMAGRVVLCGLPLLVLGYEALTHVSADASLPLLALALLVVGIGTGCTMMPAMSAAYAAVAPRSVPAATTTLNIASRLGGSIGTALIAVVLQDHLGGDGAVAGAAGPAGGGAFGATFWWPLAITAVAIAPALLLPRTARVRPTPAPEPARRGPAGLRPGR